MTLKDAILRFLSLLLPGIGQLAFGRYLMGVALGVAATGTVGLAAMAQVEYIRLDREFGRLDLPLAFHRTLRTDRQCTLDRFAVIYVALGLISSVCFSTAPMYQSPSQLEES